MQCMDYNNWAFCIHISMPGQRHFCLLCLQGVAAALCPGSTVAECGSPPSGLVMKLLSTGGGTRKLILILLQEIGPCLGAECGVYFVVIAKLWAPQKPIM
jgi:hypothetical protein